MFPISIGVERAEFKLRPFRQKGYEVDTWLNNPNTITRWYRVVWLGVHLYIELSPKEV